MQTRPPSTTGQTLLRLAQAACTLALAIILWRTMDWGRVLASLAGLRWPFILLAAVFLLAAHVFNVVRWRGLLPPRAVPTDTLSAYYGAGLFSSNFLPTGIGGDAVRAALAATHVGWSRALVSVALDRIVGLVGLSFFVLPGLWFGLPTAILERLAPPPALRAWLWPAAILAVTAATIVGGARLYRRGRDARALVAALGEEGQGAAGGGRGWLARLAAAYGLSVWSNLGTILAHWAVLKALGIAASPGATIWLVLLGSLSLLVPLSINGLGVLESVFVLVLAAYGVPGPAALAAALLIRALIMVFSLIGGALSLRVRRLGRGGGATEPAA